MWPLSNSTKGYDVISDLKSSDLSRRMFEEGPVPDTTAVVVSPDDPVRLQVSHLAFQSFSVQIYLYITGTDGDLLNFVDDRGIKIFRMWLSSKFVKVEVYRENGDVIGYITSTKRLTKLNTWVNLAFGREFDKGKMMLNIPGQAVVKSDEEFSSKEDLPNDGTFHIGGPTSRGSNDGIVSKACCLIVFDKVLPKEQLPDNQYDCTKNTGVVWAYHGKVYIESLSLHN